MIKLVSVFLLAFAFLLYAETQPSVVNPLNSNHSGTNALAATLHSPGHASVATIEDAELDIRVRLSTVSQLGSELGSSDVRRLSDFLKSHPTGESNVEGVRALKNNIMNVLRHQTVAPVDLTETLISLYQDIGQDAVIRDYAIQHLGIWYEQVAKMPGNRERIRGILQEAVSSNTSTTGTALLALHRLSRQHNEIDQTWLNESSIALVRSAETHLAARISAVQVCAERQLKEALPVIQSLARTADSVPLRLSAIAAIGRIPDASQLSLLRELENDRNESVRTTARTTMDRLNRKLEIF